MHRVAKTISIALLILWAAGAEAGVRTVPPRSPAAPALADVDLDDVPVGRALRLLAETYDVSIATGSLPDVRVTVRLRGIGAREAFAAVAAAAGLEVAQDGSIVRVGPKSPDAAAALASARQQQVTDRVFHLGVAPGEETLKAIQPLLEPHLETATYNATENLLTVSALPATLDRVAALLAELTRTPKQYEIEVQVVEVSKNALRQMGSQGSVGLDVRGGVLATTFPLSGLGAAKRYLPSPTDLAALGRLSGSGGTSGGSTETGSFSDPGFRFGRIDARGIGLLIQLLEQSGEARVMATPKVTALDNRKAKISMVTTLRIPTFTQNQAFATTTVTGIEQVDVGTTLEVRPRQGNGRQILLTVTPEVSELQPNSSVFTQSGLTQGLPIVTRRRTETEVILEAGETLVIGGLVTERKTDNHGKTPGLGDIPLIGRAFRLEGKQTESAELLVFVTPHELPPPEERRAKVRIDDAWLPAALAARLGEARALLRAQGPADRVAGVRALEEIDAGLLAAGVDAAPDVAPLGVDASLEVRAVAALFLLHARPADALAELRRFKDSRAVAVAALAAPMAPHLRAALAELAARPDPEAEPGVRAAEPALAWSGAPAEIVPRGDAAGTGLVRAALDLLARRAPDLRNLVGFGLATVEAGAAGPAVDPTVRSARVTTTAEATAQTVALQLVRLATLVFESRVHGLPTAGERILARAVREETGALERLTGGAAPAAPPAARDALAAGLRWIAADAPGTAVGPSPAISASTGGPQ